MGQVQICRLDDAASRPLRDLDASNPGCKLAVVSVEGEAVLASGRGGHTRQSSGSTAARARSFCPRATARRKATAGVCPGSIRPIGSTRICRLHAGRDSATGLASLSPGAIVPAQGNPRPPAGRGFFGRLCRRSLEARSSAPALVERSRRSTPCSARCSQDYREHGHSTKQTDSFEPVMQATS